VFKIEIIKFELNKIAFSHMVEANAHISEKLNAAIIEEIDALFKQ
jgi:hypothetical protein